MTRPRGPVRARRPGPGWVPNQHGAWAMLILPITVGSVRAGLSWAHVLLLATWLSGYLAFFATGLWLRSRRKPRYWPPVRAYACSTAALGIAVLVVEPAMVWWATVFAPLLAASLWFSLHRADRSLRNGAVTVLAACLMTVVAGGLGTAVRTGSEVSLTWLEWLPGAASPRAWILAGVLFAYFLGTVLYVKTMIRERGNQLVWRASVAYHAAVCVPVAWVDLRLGVLFALLTLRAVVVPRRWPGLSPRAVGIGEILASTVLAVLLLT
jgi:hypothetical protein